MDLKKTKYITSVLILFLVLNSCRKEKSYWDDDFVAPIAHGNLALGNLFPDTTLKSNSDSSLKIAFETNLINFGFESLLKIPDTDTVTSFIFPAPYATIGPGTTFPTPPSGEDYYDFPNGIQLKSVLIRQGAVRIKILNTVRQPLRYQYQFISAIKNNIMLDTTFDIPGGSIGNPGSTTVYLDMAGYTIDFTGINKNKFNTTVQGYSVTVAPTAVADSIYFGEGFTDSLRFMGMIPQYALGYFGNQIVAVGPDTAAFTVFKTIKSGMLNLNSANVKIKIINEFGVEMRATINAISSLSTANSQTVTLSSSAIVTPFNINSAINNGLNNPVTAATKTITINNGNSNITNFLNILPDRLGYKLTAQINPGGNQSGSNDFGYYGTGFKAYMDADIPLYFSASNLVLADTVTINLGGISQFKNINHGQLILTATNGYPFSINLQGYLLDENKQVIDILFATPNTIQAPALDVNFKVIAPLQSRLTIPLTKDKITNLQKAKYIYYTSTFNTASQPNQIKFYNYYNLDLLLTADINYSIGK